MRMVDVSDISECHSRSQHLYSLFCKAVSNYIFLMTFMHVLCVLQKWSFLCLWLFNGFSQWGMSQARTKLLEGRFFSLRLSSGIFCGVFSSSKNLETNRSHKIQFIKIFSVGERQITLSGHNTAFLLEWFGLSHHHLCLSPCGSLTLACSHLQQTFCSKGNFVLWKLWRLCFILYYGSSNILCLPFCHSESKEDITAVILLAFIVTIVNVTSLFPSYLTYLALN